MKSTLFFCPILIKLESSQMIFEKSSNIKFRQNPYSGSRVVPYGRTDLTKLIVAFRNAANAPTKRGVSFRQNCMWNGLVITENRDRVVPVSKNDTVWIYSGSVDKDPRILNHGCRRRQIGSLILQPLYCREKSILVLHLV